MNIFISAKNFKTKLSEFALQAMVYPEEAGIPVGGEHFSPFVLLEIHYNNPSRIPGALVSSFYFFLCAFLFKNFFNSFLLCF